MARVAAVTMHAPRLGEERRRAEVGVTEGKAGAARDVPKNWEALSSTMFHHQNIK